MYPFDRAWIRVPCPRCDYEVDVQFRMVLLEDVVFCPCCKVRIRLSDDRASGHRTRRSVHNALDELRNEITNLNKTLTIEI